jgi:hypothetical protein
MVTELLNLYGDKRLQERAACIEEAMVVSQSSSMHRISKNSATLMNLVSGLMVLL